MRFSTQRGDPGFKAYKALPANVVADVYVDGEVVRNCVTADSDRGFVVTNGERPELNAKRNGFRLFRRHGAVEIVLRRRQ